MNRLHIYVITYTNNFKINLNCKSYDECINKLRKITGNYCMVYNGSSIKYIHELVNNKLIERYYILTGGIN